MGRDLSRLPAELKPVTSEVKGRDAKKKIKMSKMDKFNSSKEHGIQDYNERDWVKYFSIKRSEAGVIYLSRMHDVAIMKKLMKTVNAADIKLMIDFIFDSNQNIVEKKTASISLLSSSWYDTMYSNAKMWNAGTYKPKVVKAAGKKIGRDFVDTNPEVGEIDI